jgi:hypothetical protein
MVVAAPNLGERLREEKSIDQILVPLPENDWPAHIFAKCGTNVFSLTKYDPVALKKVAFEQALQLSSVQPYASLANIGQPKQ